MARNIWNTALDDIKKKLNKKTYETWFKSTRLLKKTSNQLVIQAENEYVRDWLIDHYLDMILDVMKKQNKKNYNINFQIKNSLKNGKIIKRGTSKRINNRTNFDPKYTFDRFVVGKGNQFAHAISQAVVASPGKSYNPFFIYGGVGLGKTHLLHAIGRGVQSKYPSIKVHYVSAEQFTTEFISSLRKHTPEIFQKKFRNIDFLLVDDVEFLCGKDRSQEEFFHTFNALYENRRQLILSSDRPPNELDGLEDRLRSRVGCGLISDIKPPEFETRVAILRQRAEEMSISVPEDVLHLIANTIQNSIRNLEGTLKTIVARSVHQNQKCNIQTAGQILNEIKPRSSISSNITIDVIQRAVSRHYHISLSDLLGKKRTKNIALSRQVAIYLSRELTPLSLPEIGREFGNRDHSTVIHSTHRIRDLLKKSPEIKVHINNIKEELQ